MQRQIGGIGPLPPDTEETIIDILGQAALSRRGRVAYAVEPRRDGGGERGGTGIRRRRR